MILNLLYLAGGVPTRRAFRASAIAVIEPATEGEQQQSKWGPLCALYTMELGASSAAWDTYGSSSASVRLVICARYDDLVSDWNEALRGAHVPDRSSLATHLTVCSEHLLAERRLAGGLGVRLGLVADQAEQVPGKLLTVRMALTAAEVDPIEGAGGHAAELVARGLDMLGALAVGIILNPCGRWAWVEAWREATPAEAEELDGRPGLAYVSRLWLCVAGGTAVGVASLPKPPAGRDG